MRWTELESEPSYWDFRFGLLFSVDPLCFLEWGMIIKTATIKIPNVYQAPSTCETLSHLVCQINSFILITTLQTGYYSRRGNWGQEEWSVLPEVIVRVELGNEPWQSRTYQYGVKNTGDFLSLQKCAQLLKEGRWWLEQVQSLLPFWFCLINVGPAISGMQGKCHSAFQRTSAVVSRLSAEMHSACAFMVDACLPHLPKTLQPGTVPPPSPEQLSFQTRENPLFPRACIPVGPKSNQCFPECKTEPWGEL